MQSDLAAQFRRQQFENGYELVNGVEMHALNGGRFQIPPPVVKRNVRPGFFVEVRIDSPRFSVHEDAPEKCTCASCNGEASKPILRHDHPSSLVPLPEQRVPSRGWGEDFWVLITDREEGYLAGVVDNPLVEARLHGLRLGDSIALREDHILAMHGSHRQDMVVGMSETDLRELVAWLGSRRSD